MTKISNYLKKIRIQEQLSEDLQKLENDAEVQNFLQFERELRALLAEYGFSAKYASEVLSARKQLPPRTPRVRRSMRLYTNPHTGETIRTSGGGPKRLQAWRAKYGRAVVQTWAEVE